MIGRRQSRVSPEIPTASMADIAFLLIVFFLVTTTMNQDKGLSLHLPPVGETKEVREKNILNVWINARDQVAFFENDQLTPVPFAELKGHIEGRLRENENLIVSLKTERGGHLSDLRRCTRRAQTGRCYQNLDCQSGRIADEIRTQSQSGQRHSHGLHGRYILSAPRVFYGLDGFRAL